MSGRTFYDPCEKYFEDFAIGDLMITRGRTIDVGDLTVFAGLTGDHYQLHTDEVYCADTRFGSRIAHGPFTFTVAVGLVAISGFYGDAIVALVEISSLKALKPVFPGDTVKVHATVANMAGSNNPKYGTLHVDYSVLNQKDEQVMWFRQIMLARRATGGTPSE
jgi:3-hydroxybutyryl-CoA dehydratase